MAQTSQPMTQTVILRLRGGIDLHDFTTGSPAVQAFIKLTSIVKARHGFVCQYWGHTVEDKNIFIWSIDWKSKEDHTTFSKSESHSSIIEGLNELSNIKTNPSLITHTAFSSDASVAFRSPITEVAFMNLPNNYGDREKNLVQEAMKPVHIAVVSAGQALGSATGWVLEVSPEDTEPSGECIVLHGVFGYANIDDHWRWRNTPEHAKVIEGMEELSKRTGMKNTEASILGGRAMFHVHFQAGN